MIRPFVPPGYVWLCEALTQATRVWHPEATAMFDRELAASLEYSHARILAEQKVTPYLEDASNRLRSYLYEGKLRAVYFTSNGKADVQLGFWATAKADGAVERGYHNQLPNLPGGGTHIFVEQSELIALINEKTSNLSTQRDTSKVSVKVRSVGPHPVKREAIKAKMRAFVAREGWAELLKMTDEAMLTTFEAKRDTARRARQELETETPTEQRRNSDHQQLATANAIRQYPSAPA